MGQSAQHWSTVGKQFEFFVAAQEQCGWVSGATVVQLSASRIESRYKQAAQRLDFSQASNIPIYRGDDSFGCAVLGGMCSDQADQVCDPHSRSESFAADVAERQHETRARFFDTEKISGQVTHCEDLARDVECPFSHQTRRTQSPVNLRCFEDCGVQFRVIALQSFELQLQFS